MPATVIAERIGWRHSLTILKDRVRELRPLYLPPDPAGRTQYLAGELAQCDLWFPPVDVPLGHGQHGRPPVLVMVAGYSRVMAAGMLPSGQSPDLLAGHWELLRRWDRVPRVLVWDNESAAGMWQLLSGCIGAVPRTLLWDNEAGIGQRGRLAEGVAGFCGVLGTRLVQARPYDPETKGLVERANGYLETSFLPGRSFSSPADFNTQLADWLTMANTRQHRTLGCRPIDRWPADAAAMLTLPPSTPVTGWAATVRLGRDHYVRLDSNDYSVHPGVIGRKVAIRADLTRVQVHCDGYLVADHDRCWADHQTLTDPDHAHAATLMRARRHVGGTEPADSTVAYRDLADYDRIFFPGQEAAS